MNACFLVSLCVYILFETIAKFVAVKKTKLFENDFDGWIYIGVAGAGIVVNGMGSIIFAALGGHVHSHGCHGHSHGGQNIANPDDDQESLLSRNDLENDRANKPARDLNMSAVFVHYLGDCLASGCLLCAGLLTYFFSDRKWVLYLDPITSLLIAAMLAWSVLPVLKDSCAMLLQQTPHEISLPFVRNRLYQVKGLQGFHDLHVWELTDGIVIGTLHAAIFESQVGESEYIKEQIKKILHYFGIHSSTIQMEIIAAEGDGYSCKHNCKLDCTKDWCCKGEYEGPGNNLPVSSTMELK